MTTSAKHKFAFTGTNCSGKTTMALDVTARLKKMHVLAEVVSSQDRKITWKDVHFPIDYRAHYGMITNLIHAEVQAELKGDATVVITDRSVLDLYAIATYDHPTNPQLAELEHAILAWCSSYTKIYYLEPLTYQEDNKRPSDHFRMATHGQLLHLFDKYNLPNVIRIPRSDVFKDLKATLGIQGNPPFAEEAKWQAISNELGLSLLVKEPASEVTSDYDVWILGRPYNYSEDATKLATMFNQYWGSERIDVMLAPTDIGNSIKFAHRIYTPEVY
jgi:hypothetical protein